MIESYYSLTKPRLIMGNLVITASGFFLASRGVVNWWVLLAALVGIALVIASGCVFNNYFDREIDAKMERTKNRALVTGAIPGRNAIIYGAVLGLLGFSMLALYTNFLTVGLAVLGFVVYVALYTPLKHRSMHGPPVGSIAGAVPVVVGYCAVSNSFDAGAWILFFILVFWQMPHFYAIAIYRFDEYKAASIPVLPVEKGMWATKIQVVFFVILFSIAAHLLAAFHYVGHIYLVIATLLSLTWLGFALKGFWVADDKRWARKMFFMSLIVLLVLCLTMSIDVLF